MKNLIQNTTAFAMSIATGYVTDGGLIIDATCGGGRDTLQLAEYLRGESLHGQIVAIDIQPAAIERTKALLESKG
ncbi:MAG: methyltransferase domain-containing protein, partial [Firmicutes bacterium]|nr:methyltransferase domain-containing protein [Bacillota bacterium]